MSVKTINYGNFKEEVLNLTKPVLIDFWASWCGPCRMLSPIIDEVSNEREDIVVGKINVDEEPELAAEFAVMSIPTVLLFKEGKVVKTSVGSVPKQRILSLLD